MCLQVPFRKRVAVFSADLFKHTLLTQRPAIVRSGRFKNGCREPAFRRAPTVPPPACRVPCAGRQVPLGDRDSQRSFAMFSREQTSGSDVRWHWAIQSLTARSDWLSACKVRTIVPTASQPANGVLNPWNPAGPSTCPTSVCRNARQAVRDRYDWRRLSGRLLSVYGQVRGQRPPVAVSP